MAAPWPTVVSILYKQPVIESVHCQHVLAVMVTAGLDENSGDWLYETGLPGKSGVSGGIVTVSPGKGGLRLFRAAARRGGTASKASLRPILSEQLGLKSLRVRDLVFLSLSFPKRTERPRCSGKLGSARVPQTLRAASFAGRMERYLIAPS